MLSAVSSAKAICVQLLPATIPKIDNPWALQGGFEQEEHPLKQAPTCTIGFVGCNYVMSLLHPDASEGATAESALQSAFLAFSSPQPAANLTPGNAPAPAPTAVGTQSTAAAMQPFAAAEPSNPADSASSICYSTAANLGLASHDHPAGVPMLSVNATSAGAVTALQVTSTASWPASHLHTGAGASYLPS